MQAPHDALPDRDHDEASRQDFLQELRTVLTGPLSAGNRAVYDGGGARGRFLRAHRREPEDRHEVRQLMLEEPYHQLWSSLMRCTQEMLFGTVSEWAAQSAHDATRNAPPNRPGLGTLRLDPKLKVPNYLSAVDIHCMPGGYLAETGPNDMATGLVYDRAVYIYMMGRLGPMNAACGETIARYIRNNFSALRPRRILDVGCGVGHSTLPYVTAFPGAEVHGIDISGPMLRYAHARAGAIGTPVHFAQDNAEATRYPAEHFDLVVSHITLHETSRAALRNIMAEGRRLLRPGGIMLHAEGSGFEGKSLINQYLADWDTYFNAEPFIGALHDTDLHALLTSAGFAGDEVILTYSEEGHARHGGGGLRLIGGRKGR